MVPVRGCSWLVFCKLFFYVIGFPKSIMAASSADAKSQNFRLTPKSRQHHSTAPFADEAVIFWSWSTLCSNPEKKLLVLVNWTTLRCLFLKKGTRWIFFFQKKWWFFIKKDKKNASRYVTFQFSAVQVIRAQHSSSESIAISSRQTALRQVRKMLPDF